MKKINVLFMQSQTYFGADTMTHGLIMKYLDRDEFNVHVACNAGKRGEHAPALDRLSSVPALHIRPTNFGPNLNELSAKEVIRDSLREGMPFVASMAGLVRYARKHRIDIVHGTEKPRDAFYGLLV